MRRRIRRIEWCGGNDVCWRSYVGVVTRHEDKRCQASLKFVAV